MKRKIFGSGHLWINFNIILFSGYVLFGILSFFIPAPIQSIWLILGHLAGLIVDLFVIYGLVLKKFRINYLIIIISFFMVLHLLLFIFVPLGMVLAYIGPSRAFYTLFPMMLSMLGGERFISSALTLFNSAMVVIHLINIFYFTRKNIADLFRA